MARKHRNLGPVSGEKEDEESWMITYADAVTLLLCFFVTLTAISKINVPIFEEISAGIAAELGKRKIETPPVAQLEATISQILDNNGISREVALERGEDNESVIMEFHGRQLFGSANANLVEGAQIVLEEVAINMQRANFANFRVAVEAYVDEGAGVGRFRNEYELTAARAASVATFFEDLDIPPHRIFGVGYGAGRPKFEAPTEGRLVTGEPVKVDGERIVLRITPIPESDEIFSYTPDTAPKAPDLSGQ